MADDNLKKIEDINLQVQQQLEKIRRQFGMLYDDENKQCPSSPQQNRRNTQTTGQTASTASPPDFWSELARVRAQYGIPQGVQEQPPVPPPASPPCPRQTSPAPPSQPARTASPVKVSEQPRSQANAGPKPDFWTELARVKAQYLSPPGVQDQPRAPLPSSHPYRVQDPIRTPPPPSPPCPRQPSPAAVRTPSPVNVPEQPRSQANAGPKPDFWTELARVKAQYLSPPPHQQSHVPVRTPSPVQRVQEQPQAPSGPPCVAPAATRAHSPVQVPEQTRSQPSAGQPLDFWTELARVKAQYLSPPASQQVAAPRTPSPVPCPSQQPMTVRTPSPAQARPTEQARSNGNKPDFWTELARVKAQYPSPPERGAPSCPSKQSTTPSSLPSPMMPTGPQRPFVHPGLPRGPRLTKEQERALYQQSAQPPPADEATMYWATAAAEAETYWDPQYSSYYDEGPLPNPFIQDGVVEEFDPLYSSSQAHQQCPHWGNHPDSGEQIEEEMNGIICELNGRLNGRN